MRIVVSGTHASGKSTLISDLAARHPGLPVLPDPFESLDEFAEADASAFVRQLRLAADRLLERTGPLLAERGPLDFLAYLDALRLLGRPGVSGDLRDRLAGLTGRAMAGVDLLVLLPLERSRIGVPDDEDPELREAMDACLVELADDPDLVPGRTVELTGDPDARLAALEDALSAGRT